MKRVFRISFVTLLSLFLIDGLSLTRRADAKVTGVCYNCHTMHNSQDGAAVLRTGSGTGWNSSGQLSGGSIQSAPAENLLITNCVGCHSSTTGDTIITVGSSKVPIVYNTGGYPANPLAGGNFYQVAQGGAENDIYGHNVYGISAPDNNLSQGPGNKRCGSFASPCHKTLAAAPQFENFNRGGCKGCHYNVFHHTDNDQYRFLNGHEGTDHYVTGVEDDDWEQETATDHNEYKGFDGPVTDSGTLESTNSISTFCSGCHYYFHRDTTTSAGIGDSSPWLRHPTDIKLPETGEYSAYDPPTQYSNEAPVAYTDPSNTSRSTAIVMCLSCHRPHGSDQPDMLRWDYSGMIADGGANSSGCFTCHTTKDDGS